MSLSSKHDGEPDKSSGKRKRVANGVSSAEAGHEKQVQPNTMREFAVPTKDYDGGSLASSKRPKASTRHLRTASIASSVRSGGSTYHPAIEIQTFSPSAFESPRRRRNERSRRTSRLSRESSIISRPDTEEDQKDALMENMSIVSDRSGSRTWQSTDWATLEAFLAKNKSDNAELSDERLGVAFASYFEWPEETVHKRIKVIRMRYLREEQREEERKENPPGSPMVDSKKVAESNIKQKPKGLFRRLSAMIWAR